MNKNYYIKVPSKLMLCGLFFLLFSCSKKNLHQASNEDKWHKASLEIENSISQYESETNASSSIEEISVDEEGVAKEKISDAANISPSLNSTPRYFDNKPKSVPVEVKGNEKLGKKSIKKSQMIKQIKALSNNIKTGLILILVGLGISVLLGALMGGLFYTIGGVVIVVGIVFLILGILGA